MSEKILVVLRRRDQIEEVIPYLERLIRPGITVVFLIRYPVEFQRYLRDHRVTTESARAAGRAGGKLMDRYCWAVQRGIAEQMIISAREALHKTKVQVQVDLYTGSLRRAVLDYTAHGDPLWIVIPARGSHWSGRLWKRAIAPFDWFKFVFYYAPLLRLCGPASPMITVASLQFPTKERTGVDRVGAKRISLSQAARIVHDLRNHVSALLLGIETIETCPGHPTPCNDKVETLENLVYKMNCLLEQLAELTGEQGDQKKTSAAEKFAVETAGGEV